MSKTEIEHSETSDDAGDEHDHPSDNKYIQISSLSCLLPSKKLSMSVIVQFLTSKFSVRFLYVLNGLI